VKRFAPISLSVLTGVLFALALPPCDLEWLGWAAFAPLLFAAARTPRRLHAFGLGMLAAVAAGVTQVGWSSDASGLRYAYLPYLWIGLVLGAVAAAASAARRRWPEAADAPKWVLSVAAAGVAAEWLMTFTPLPVGVALCQYRNVSLLQTASVAGIWGVSFLLYLVTAALADALLRRRVLKPVALPALAAVAVAFVCGRAMWGWNASGDTVRVAAIQDFSGIDVKELDPSRMAQQSSPDRDELTRQAAARGARLIVQSEGSLGSGYRPNDATDETNRLARETKTYLVAGHSQTAAPKDWNCATLIDPEGAARATHHKIKLFLGERSAVQAGTHVTVADTDLGRVGLLICFDTCYPAVVRQAALQGAQILAVPNYDPPTPRATLHHLHAALVPFRAAENGVAIVRADPNGRSQIIDRWGRIAAEAPLYQATAVVTRVALRTDEATLYTRFGDWFAYLSTGTAVLLLLPRRRRTTQEWEQQDRDDPAAKR